MNNAERFLAPMIVFSAISLLAWIVFSTIRRYQIAKFQTSVQMKLLEKIDSSQALLAYVETEGGRRFLETLTVEQLEPTTPYRRILTGVQIGITLSALGAGFLVVHSMVLRDNPDYTVFGILALALGVGSVVSAAACYVLSRSFGLLQHGSNS